MPIEREEQAVGGQREGDRVAQQQEDHQRREHDRRHVDRAEIADAAARRGRRSADVQAEEGEEGEREQQAGEARRRR